VTQQPRATIDFETRSECSIRNCGSWRYSLDPTTSILCLGFRLPYWTEGRTALWHPAFPHLGIAESDTINDLSELFEWTMNGGLVEAHNAWFERGIWVNQCLPMGWPEIAPQQWR
jgi:DNA polymerase